MSKGQQQSQDQGLSIVVGKMETANSFGVQLQGLSGPTPASGTMLVTISDDGEFLDGWEEKQRAKMNVEVARIQNAVVVYVGDFRDEFAAGKRPAGSCLQSGQR